MSLESKLTSIEDHSSKVEPLVSVILVCYNVEKYLEEALDSIWAQGYPCIEVVMCDDASTDNTRDIMLRHAELHRGKVITSFSRVNQGFTCNWRRGVKLATGKYVVKLDGDDVWLPGKLWSQVGYMEENPGVIACYHDQEVFRSNDGCIVALMSEIDPPYWGGIREVARYGTFACVTTMVRNHRNIPLPNTLLKYGSDWLWIFEVLGGGGKLAFLEGVYSRYRRHEGNVTSKRLLRVQLDHFIAAMVMIIKRPDQIINVTYRIVTGGLGYIKRTFAKRDFFEASR